MMWTLRGKLSEEMYRNEVGMDHVCSDTRKSN